MDRSQLQARVLAAGDGRRLNVLGDNVTIRLSAMETGGALTLIEQNNPPGVGIPTHIHSREDEVFHIVEGRVKFTVADQTILAGPGSTVLGPRNVPHSFVVVGDKPAKTMVFIVPGGIDGMFEELGRLPDGPPDMGKVAEICARQGISFCKERE